MKRTVVAASVASALALFAVGKAQASGFALTEQGASGLGNAYAGAAASAEDATTVWWNPAGMSRLPSGRHIAVAADLIDLSTKFHNGSSVPAAASDPTKTGEGGDAGTTSLVPSLFFAMDLNPKWNIGLAINSPFGLKTDYDADWIGRFQGVKSEVKTVNFNPAVSYKLSDSASVGFGISYQHGKIDLDTATNYSGIAFAAGGAGLLGAVGGPGVEGVNTTSIDGNAWGFNIGGLWSLSPATRVGAHYRSSLSYDMEGTTSFTNVPAAFAGIPQLAVGTSNGDVKMSIDTPASLSLSAVHGWSERLELLADATWTQWSKIDQIPVVRSSGPGSGSTLDTLAFKFRDTWRLSLGANYKLSEPWTLKAGVAYDQSPVPDAENRSVRLPDADRYWLSVGASYQASRNGKLDLGYTFIKVHDPSINNDQQALGRGLVNGTYSTNINIFGVQYQYSF